MAKPDGTIVETPIIANFREGLDVLQYFISTNGARKGLVDTALKTANSGYLTRRLVDVAQDVVVTEEDCQTREGINIAAIIEGGDELVPLGERILGRVLAVDVMAHDGEKVLLERNTLISESEVALLEQGSIDQVRVRSVMTCDARYGVCAKCYGRDLARGHLVNLGEAVGVVAAQSIGEPGTQLTMRTFHIGGAASKGVLESSIQVSHSGSVVFQNVRTVENSKGDLVVISRSGHVSIRNDKGRECERYKATYGSVFTVKHGDSVNGGDTIATWDPHTHPIVAEVEGKVELVDFVDGVTVTQQTDEVTGLSSTVVLPHDQQSGGKRDLRPMVRIVDAKGKVISLPGSSVTASYFLRKSNHYP